MPLQRWAGQGLAAVAKEMTKAMESDPTQNKVRPLIQFVQDLSLCLSILDAQSLETLDKLYEKSDPSTLNEADNMPPPMRLHRAINESIAWIYHYYDNTLLDEKTDSKASIETYQKALLSLIIANLKGFTFKDDTPPIPYEIMSENKAYSYAQSQGWLTRQGAEPMEALLSLLTEYLDTLEGLKSDTTKETDTHLLEALLSSSHLFNDASNAFSADFTLPFDQKVCLAILSHFRQEPATDASSTIIETIQEIHGKDAKAIQYAELIHCCVSKDYADQFVEKAQDLSFTLQDSALRLSSAFIQNEDKISNIIREALTDSEIPLNKRLLLIGLACISGKELSELKPVVEKLTRSDPKEIVAKTLLCFISPPYLEGLIKSPPNEHGPEIYHSTLPRLAQKIGRGIMIIVAFFFTMLSAMLTLVLYQTSNLSRTALATYFSMLTVSALTAMYLCFRYVYKPIQHEIKLTQTFPEAALPPPYGDVPPRDLRPQVRAG